MESIAICPNNKSGFFFFIWLKNVLWFDSAKKLNVYEFSEKGLNLKMSWDLIGLHLILLLLFHNEMKGMVFVLTSAQNDV